MAVSEVHYIYLFLSLLVVNLSTCTAEVFTIHCICFSLLPPSTQHLKPKKPPPPSSTKVWDPSSWQNLVTDMPHSFIQSLQHFSSQQLKSFSSFLLNINYILQIVFVCLCVCILFCFDLFYSVVCTTEGKVQDEGSPVSRVWLSSGQTVWGSQCCRGPRHGSPW